MYVAEVFRGTSNQKEEIHHHRFKYLSLFVKGMWKNKGSYWGGGREAN